MQSTGQNFRESTTNITYALNVHDIKTQEMGWVQGDAGVKWAPHWSNHLH